MFTVSMLATTLFLGGWNGPFVKQLPWLGVFYFLGKVIGFLFSISGCGARCRAFALIS